MSLERYRELPPYAEIANLEHELTVLSERRLRLETQAGRNRLVITWGFGLTLACMIGALAYAIATNDGDAIAKVFLFLVLFGAAGLSGWLLRDKDWAYMSLGYDGSPFRSGKEFLDHAIAVRQKRLEELKAQP